MGKIISTFLLSLSVIVTSSVHGADDDFASYRNQFNRSPSTQLPALNNSIVTNELVQLVSKRIPFVAHLVDNLELSVLNLAPEIKTKPTDWSQNDFNVELIKIKRNLCKSEVEVLTHIQKIALLTRSIKALGRGEKLPPSNRYRGETIDNLLNKLKFVKADFVNDIGYSIQTTVPLLKAMFDQLIRQTHPSTLSTQHVWVNHFERCYRMAQDYCQFITKGEKTIDEILALPEIKAAMPSSPYHSPTRLSPEAAHRLKEIGQKQIFNRAEVRTQVGLPAQITPPIHSVQDKIRFFNGLDIQQQNTSGFYLNWRKTRK